MRRVMVVVPDYTFDEFCSNERERNIDLLVL